MSCTLCEKDGGALIWRNDRLRIVSIDDPHYPGFCRVIWNAHVKEMTDLSPADQTCLLETVLKVEQAMRTVMRPDKINLASFGNQVPHLHWHVIPRFTDDHHFPDPVWASPVAKPESEMWQIRHAERQAKGLALIAHLQALSYSA